MVFIYDIKTGKKDCELFFDSTVNGVSFYKPHGNQVSFGISFYNEQSDFPLLYVSQVNGGNGYNDLRGESGVLVYDLRRKEKNQYEPVLVQVIIPDTDDGNLMQSLANYTPNYIVDKANGQILIIGYPYSSWFILNFPQPVTIVEIPSLTKEIVVKITHKDIIDSYSFPTSLPIQQSVIHNGLIYTAAGIAKKGVLRISSIENRTIEKEFLLSELTSCEPQFVVFWQDRLLYYEAGVSGQVYELVCYQNEGE